MYTFGYSPDKQTHLYGRMQSENESVFYWFVSKEVLQSSAIGAPCLIMSKANKANSQPAKPPNVTKEG